MTLALLAEKWHNGRDCGGSNLAFPSWTIWSENVVSKCPLLEQKNSVIWALIFVHSRKILDARSSLRPTHTWNEEQHKEMLEKTLRNRTESIRSRLCGLLVELWDEKRIKATFKAQKIEKSFSDMTLTSDKSRNALEGWDSLYIVLTYFTSPRVSWTRFRAFPRHKMESTSTLSKRPLCFQGHDAHPPFPLSFKTCFVWIILH